jgi:prepilin-type N-terminal cleavage/methylation domain-containing protein
MDGSTTRSEAPPAGGRAGFSLIEIVMALVLLAIGLLGVEALGVYASRLIARAEKSTVMIAAATDTLERTVIHIRQGDIATPPLSQSYTLGTGDTVGLKVTRSLISNASTGTPYLWTVQVSVYPKRRGTLLQRSDSVGMISNVIQ